MTLHLVAHPISNRSPGPSRRALAPPFVERNVCTLSLAGQKFLIQAPLTHPAAGKQDQVDSILLSTQRTIPLVWPSLNAKSPFDAYCEMRRPCANNVGSLKPRWPTSWAFPAERWKSGCKGVAIRVGQVKACWSAGSMSITVKNRDQLGKAQRPGAVTEILGLTVAALFVPCSLVMQL